MDLTPAERLAGLLTAVATAVVITAVAVVPFLSPAWVSFEQGRAQAEAWTGYTTAELGSATDAILADLVIGPPDFDVVVGGEPVLTERERSHMRDVRGVFAGFALVALIAAAGLLAAFVLARRRGHPQRAWRAIRNGARWLAVGIVAAGVIALVAFDAAFEVFHRLFFSGGSYTFDPGTERLVQLFPFTFWSETSIAVGLVIFVLSLGVAFFAGRRLRAHAGPVVATAPGIGGHDPSPDAAR